MLPIFHLKQMILKVSGFQDINKPFIPPPVQRTQNQFLNFLGVNEHGTDHVIVLRVVEDIEHARHGVPVDAERPEFVVPVADISSLSIFCSLFDAH